VNINSNNQQTCFEGDITALLKQLGIPQDYGRSRQLALQQECQDLVSIGKDIFDREQSMSKQAALAWLDMKNAAASDQIVLQPVSAFRGIEYQTGIIKRKLEAGQCMDDILEVSAAPGYSEHHSGRALDLTTPGFEPLEEVFETSEAFNWLQNEASQFNFRLSYPRGNPHSVAYEPWHWCWNKP
jgi:D-alanyl-D-alanine carboxypeptidase